MNPACDVSPEELIAFTEEDLPERRMKQLEAHVPDCPHCQQRLEGADRIGSILSTSLPEPSDYARHDLMVRLYREAEGQQDRPHRDWAHVASVSAVCGTFLLAAIMLWSGLGTFVDAIQSPFQRASQDQSSEWVVDVDDADEVFQNAPLPNSLGDSFPLDDWWIRSGIRVIVYQERQDPSVSLEVSQFPIEGGQDPPGYMTEAGDVDGVSVYVDDPEQIEEFRWVDRGMAHHAQFLALDDSPKEHLTWDDAEAIVQAFLNAQ